MKWIEYDYVCNANKGISLHKKVEYNEENIAIAEKEAINGKYVITEDESESIEKKPLSIEQGGTGANTAFDAIQKLGVAPAALGLGRVGGTLIAVNDSGNVPLQSLKLFGKTTQNGTPSPDSPVSLVVVGDSGAIKTTVCGKNLLPYPYKSTNAISGGLIYEVQNDGGIKISGTKTGASYFNILGAIGDDYQTEKICFTKPVYLLIENGFSISARLTDGTYTEISGDKALNKPIGALYVNCNAANNTAINTVLYPMVSYINSTEYEPYNGQALTVATPNGLPGIPVASGGNYTDENGQQWICDEIDFARGVYVQRVGNVTFNGTETLQETSANYIYTKANFLKPPKPSSLVVSTHMPVAERVNAAQNLLFPKTVFNFNSVDDFKAYLSEQSSNGTPLVCLLELAVPIETALSAEELTAFAALHTNKPNTTVYNDAGAHMEIGYYTPISALPVAGGAMGGNLRMSGNKITDLGTPTLDTDAANKAYVDSASRVVNGVEEWINPTMMIGVEYRTTERYDGKAVYAKLVDFGMLPNATSKMAAYCGTGSTGAVSVKALLSDGCVLGEGYGKDTRYSSAYGVYIDNTLYNVQITAESDFSGLSAKILVKYTKD